VYKSVNMIYHVLRIRTPFDGVEALNCKMQKSAGLAHTFISPA
jgi:hypothetical protein